VFFLNTVYIRCFAQLCSSALLDPVLMNVVDRWRREQYKAWSTDQCLALMKALSTLAVCVLINHDCVTWCLIVDNGNIHNAFSLTVLWEVWGWLCSGSRLFCDVCHLAGLFFNLPTRQETVLMSVQVIYSFYLCNSKITDREYFQF